MLKVRKRVGLSELKETGDLDKLLKVSWKVCRSFGGRCSCQL